MCVSREVDYFSVSIFVLCCFYLIPVFVFPNKARM